MNAPRQAIPMIGRLIFAAIFLMSGLGKIGNWDGTAGYMAAQGMPWVPLFLFGALALEILGGASIVVGFKARWGAVALMVFLVPATLIFHNFWAFEGQAMQQQMIHFLKNLSILGGLILILANGAGSFSIDARLARAQASSTGTSAHSESPAS